ESGERREMFGLIDHRRARLAMHFLQSDDVGGCCADHFRNLRQMIGTPFRGVALDVVRHDFDREHSRRILLYAPYRCRPLATRNSTPQKGVTPISGWKATP